MDERIPRLIDRLAANNIPAVYAEDRSKAVGTVLSMIPEGSVVGFGDSMTVRQVGLLDAIEKGNYTPLNPWKPGLSAEESTRLKKRSLTSDVFVAGTNALTLGGKIVNVDGLGNRVAGMLLGPDRVVLVAGVNKFVEDLEQALDRIKRTAAPLNCNRHADFDPMPPCGVTGTCHDCSDPWRICNKTVIIERQYDNARYKPVITVVIVGEALGL